MYQLCYVLSWRALTGTFTWLLPAAFPGPHPAAVQQQALVRLQGHQGKADGSGCVFQKWAYFPICSLYEICLLFF